MRRHSHVGPAVSCKSTTPPRGNVLRRELFVPVHEHVIAFPETLVTFLCDVGGV